MKAIIVYYYMVHIALLIFNFSKLFLWTQCSNFFYIHVHLIIEEILCSCDNRVAAVWPNIMLWSLYSTKWQKCAVGLPFMVPNIVY
jgi:hypothetical protein